MTVTSSTNRASYSGNGSLTTFAYGFKIFDQDELTVILRSSAGVETVQTLTTHYSVTGVGAAGGGNVVFGTAPAAGVTIVVLRELDLEQGLNLVPNDPFPAESLESSLDKLTFMVQQHNEELGRTIKASRTNVLAGSEFTILAADRANKVFSFDGSGDLAITQELGTFKGNWAASTVYKVRDLVKDTSTNNIFMVKTAHTSSGSQPITTNTDAAKWDLIVNAAAATTSATAAAASETAAETAETNAETAQAASEAAKDASVTAKDASVVAKNASVAAKDESVTAKNSSESALASFTGQYATGSSDPSSNLNTGDLFFNSSTNLMKVYTGSAWVALTPSSSAQTNINALAASAVLADMAILGTDAIVADMAILGTDAVVADMAILATSAIVADMAILGTADVVNDMNILGTSDVVTDMNVLATSDVVTDMNVLATADVVNDMNVLGTSATVTAMNLLGTSGNVTAMSNVSGAISNVNTVAGIASNVTTVAGVSSSVSALAASAVLADMAILATDAIVADMAILATDAIVADMAILATDAIVADLAILATSDVVTDMNVLATSDVVNDMNVLGTSANVTAMSNVSGSISNVNTVASNLASVNSFANTYRIASSAPSSSLNTGDLYFNTSTNVVNVYNGSAWVAAYASLSGALTVSNNLSDLANAGTARTNLGLGSAATTASTAYAPAAGSSNVVTTGALNSGSITSGFGAIDNGASNITTTGVGTFASLDISGDVDVDGTLEADAITLNGTALGSLYSPIAGSSSVVTTGALNSGSITSGFGAINVGSSAISTSGLITAGEVTMTTLDIGGTNVTATAAEINYLDIATLGTSAASKVVTSDANNVVTFSGGIVEDSVTVSSSSAALTLDMRLGTNFIVDLTENITGTTFSNPGGSGNVSAFSLKVIQGSTARTIAWPSAVDWPAATAPTLTTTDNGVDMFVFQTMDGGTTWYGFVAGQALA